jgi:hypothetical protein
VVLCDNLSTRDEWIVDVTALLDEVGTPPRKVKDAELAFTDPTGPLLIVPEPGDEAAVVERLSVARDRLNQRRAVAVLFLLRDGAGMKRLQDEPPLASFLTGVTLDPEQEATIDVEAERDAFMAATGLHPNEWLNRYRAGHLPDTLENSLLHLRAILVEAPR